MANRIELGDEVEDSITGFSGIAVALTEWLYNCRRVTVQPKGLEKGLPLEPVTFDEPQLKIVKRAGVAPVKLAKTGGPKPEPRRHAVPRR